MTLPLKEKKSLGARWAKSDFKRLNTLWNKAKPPITGYLIGLVRQDKPEDVLQKTADGWSKRNKRRHVFPIIINAYKDVKDIKKFEQSRQKKAKVDIRK